MLPQEILEDVQAELLNWRGLGMSVMEIGHRTPEFMQLLAEAKVLLRQLLQIPDTYEVLFLGGAARTQFGMVPLNFLAPGETAGYFVTGIWSAMAYQEASRIKNAYCIASSQSQGYIKVPSPREYQFQDNSAYLYFTPNETINGVRCDFTSPDPQVPLVADMTSCLLAEPIQVSNYGLIFAGAQKNIANSGLTLVIVKKDWLSKINSEQLPSMLDYRLQAEHHSLYATPPTFNCYMALKMFQWVKKQGGVDAMYKKNQWKARQLYDFIDASNFYYCPVDKADRSLFNVCFRTEDPKLEPLFLEAAKEHGLLALKGHREVGGLRASLYNAMPLEGVEKLLSFMDDFARRRG